tara:strand:- start:696 stop:839 length:144 start_codon:yes stop_codon:yes gene_type:complete
MFHNKKNYFIMLIELVSQFPSIIVISLIALTILLGVKANEQKKQIEK